MTPAEPPDAGLVSLAMEHYQSRLIRYAASILGDLERAREVVQDTFLKLCTESPGRVRDHLPQWLFTVCRNRALDVLKKEKRTSPLNAVDLETRPSPAPRPLTVLEQAETLDRVFELVAALPDREREVLTLKFQCDLSYKEISEVTGLSTGNVGFLIHTGIRRIREQIRLDVPSAPSLIRRLS